MIFIHNHINWSYQSEGVLQIYKSLQGLATRCTKFNSCADVVESYRQPLFTEDWLLHNFTCL